MTLSRNQADSWIDWPNLPEAFTAWSSVWDSLVAKQFVVRRHLGKRDELPDYVANHIPKRQERYCKFYAETPDLYILFNTRTMSTNNPLLVLGPYGSLCWRDILEGRSIEEIQLRAVEVFGCDEVYSFLRRLSHQGFIEPLPPYHLQQRADHSITAEFLAPQIQFLLPYTRIPWYCLWEVCTTCDLTCKTCYLPAVQHGGPSEEGALKIVKKIAEAGVFFVSIMGGEPLLRQDLESLVSNLRLAGIYVKIITNGQQLDAERAKSLSSSGVNQVEISFDGLCSESHDYSRGLGTFELAVAAVKRALSARIPRVGMVWTVHSGNSRELNQLPSFMKSLNIHECYISTFRKTGRGGELSDLKPMSVQEETAFAEKLALLSVKHSSLSMTLLRKCSCGRSSVVVGCDNSVRPCPFAFGVYGNLDTNSLVSAWNRITENLPSSGSYRFCRELQGVRL